MTIPPVHRTINVPWPVDRAFRRFTTEIMTWWPYQTHSVGGKQVQEIKFEERVGGRIYEEHRDGRRFLWGTVLEWDPPQRVRFTWHPSRDAQEAQEVELRFTPDGTGTRLDLIHSGWERLGRKGPRARKGYNLGWRYVLDIWSGHRTWVVSTLDLVVAITNLAARLKPKSGDPRDKAQGEIPRSQT